MKLRELLKRLTEHKVRFVVIGGVALIARGVQRATEDLDIAYARDRENLSRLADALASIHPKLRGVEGELPLVLDEASLRSGLNFTLDTDLGPLDLLGEVAGLGSFAHVDAAASELIIEDTPLLVLTLDGLERSKRAAGRPKDLVDLGSIKALRE
ncbi:MAG: nucleotidyl transferase AbiEii/AbiGii toxin family protein [Myxococcota bacterium]